MHELPDADASFVCVQIQMDDEFSSLFRYTASIYVFVQLLTNKVTYQKETGRKGNGWKQTDS